MVIDPIPRIQEIHSLGREHQLVSIQDVEQIQRPRRQNLKSPDVPARALHGVRDLHHQEHRLLLRVQPPPPHRLHEIPRLRRRELVPEVLHDRHAPGRAAQRGRDRELLLLPVDLDGPVPRLGAEDDASTGPERGGLGAPAGPAGLLLRVGLPAAPTDLAAGERGGRAAALVLAVGDEGPVHDGAGRVGRRGPEVEVGLADLLAGEVEDGERGELGGDGEGPRSGFRGTGPGEGGGLEGFAVGGGGGGGEKRRGQEGDGSRRSESRHFWGRERAETQKKKKKKKRGKEKEVVLSGFPYPLPEGRR